MRTIVCVLGIISVVFGMLFGFDAYSNKLSGSATISGISAGTFFVIMIGGGIMLFLFGFFFLKSRSEQSVTGQGYNTGFVQNKASEKEIELEDSESSDEDEEDYSATAKDHYAGREYKVLRVFTSICEDEWEALIYLRTLEGEIYSICVYYTHEYESDFFLLNEGDMVYLEHSEECLDSDYEVLASYLKIRNSAVSEVVSE